MQLSNGKGVVINYKGGGGLQSGRGVGAGKQSFTPTKQRKGGRGRGTFQPS